ncbi:MAG: DUF503 domain-containing protein [Deltaproteobacteria bacterium]|nr:DUF503 domain-containing protein [Deltaproteobacteria bacterium]
MGVIIHDSCSLKGKRHVLKKVIENVKNRFNVSVAEVGSQDLWQKAEIGVSAIGSDGATINSVMDRVLNFIEGLNMVEVIEHDIELINCSPFK